MLIIYVYNVSGGEVSDYKYEVMVNKEQIASGDIKGHKRDLGWVELVQKIVDNETEPYGGN